MWPALFFRRLGLFARNARLAKVDIPHSCLKRGPFDGPRGSGDNRVSPLVQFNKENGLCPEFGSQSKLRLLDEDVILNFIRSFQPPVHIYMKLSRSKFLNRLLFSRDLGLHKVTSVGSSTPTDTSRAMTGML